MTSIFRFSVRMSLLLVLSAGFAGCDHEVSDRAAMIPEDATAAFSLDIGDMSTKAVSFSDLWEMLTRKADSEEMAERLENSGIDFTGSLLGFAKVNDVLTQRAVLIVPLSDADAFEATLRDGASRLGRRLTFGDQDGFRTALDLNEQGGYVWNESTAVIISGNNLGGERAILGYGVALFSLSEGDQLVRQSDRFRELLTDGHDGTFYLSYEDVSSLAALNPMTRGMDVEDVRIHGSLDFEDGLIRLAAATHYLKGGDRYEDLIEDPVDPELLAGLSREAPVGVMGFAVDPDEMLDLMDEQGLKEEAEREFRSEGLNLDELVRAWSGQVGLLVNEIRMEKPAWAGEYSSTREATPWVAVAIGVDDREVFTDALRQAVEDGELSQQGNQYRGNDGKTFLLLEPERLILLTEAEQFEAIAAGEGQNLTGPARELLEAYPLFATFSFEQLPDQVMWDLIDNVPAEYRKPMIEQFPLTRVELYSEAPDDDQVKGELRIYTRDEDDNALRTLVRYFQDMVEATEQEPVM